MTPAELQATRKRLGLSQDALGKLLGVPQNTISRWELGLVPIARPAMLARALRDIEHERGGRREIAMQTCELCGYRWRPIDIERLGSWVRCGNCLHWQKEVEADDHTDDEA